MTTKAQRRSELAERLAELQAAGVPRASLALCRDRIGLPDGIADPAVEAALDEYLSHYAWMYGEAPPHKPGTVTCPGCGSQGWFEWGVVHGAGSCARCEWPGRLYHFVADPAPDAPCRYCGRPPGEHEGGERVRESGGVYTDETFRRCPGSHDEYQPRDAFRMTFLLWAHPDEVALNEKKARR